MLGYTRMRNGLCAICRWGKNSEVNRRGRDKKITPGVAVHKTGLKKQILWQLPDKGC